MRFKYYLPSQIIEDKVTGRRYYGNQSVADLLNELHDEKQSVIKWIDRKIEEIKPYNSELCRATLLELKEFLE